MLSIFRVIRNFKRNPLHLAAENGNTIGVKSLIQENSDVNARDFLVRTALHLAAGRGHRDVVISLLEAGANPYLGDFRGKTPMEVTENNEIARWVRFYFRIFSFSC